MGPGIGGLEILVIGLLALIVVGPKDLPLLMRKVGKAVGKARAMANEFRSSFDEMARQSELDELRKEVEALRTGQGMVPLGAEAEAAFRDISDDLNRPLDGPATQPALTGPDEWPDSEPVMKPLVEAEPVSPRAAPKPRAKKPSTTAAPASAKPPSKKSAPARTEAVPARPKAPRKKAVDL
ncbi:MAG: Sec-independent protein translocase protein TatB [Brevundimonas sp.]|uniref:Sec-independent protein translocase protein TatB n=1 Tax=Brevundimonas sp. TaxID=1871086 RepID=UPI00261D1DE8|nr:Sec-independent protein translocase protein TatB [Brevundimonas sp.]MDI6625207.1 Sec-independent protein translocase protein TatB [Brevundimonas sp.]MDQ7814018.1 Sec-independent protein translocase protein TatB [Brevundimonas sp.]